MINYLLITFIPWNEIGKTAEDALVVGNISKSYGNFCAVSKLSFGVHHGECFGLLRIILNFYVNSSTFVFLICV